MVSSPKWYYQIHQSSSRSSIWYPREKLESVWAALASVKTEKLLVAVAEEKKAGPGESVHYTVDAVQQNTAHVQLFTASVQ